MKIMFAVATYWPFQDGVAHVTKYLAEGLAKKGHKILVYTSTGNQNRLDIPLKEEHNGVEIERIRVFIRWPIRLKGLDSESNPAHYFRRIKEFSPDVLIIVCAQTWTLDWIMPYLDQLECKKVFYSHGFSSLKDKYDIKEELVKRNLINAYIEYKKKVYFNNLYKFIEKFDKAIYISDIEKGYQYVLEHGLKNGVILENAIEDIFFADVMQHNNDIIRSRKIQFLCVANYNENKNQEMLIRAYKEAKIGKSKVIFVGSIETPYLSFLRKEAIDLLGSDPEKEIEFKVGVERKEVYDLYRESDIYICTSKHETASVVLYEAAATKMPVVSTKVGLAEKMDGIVLVNQDSDLKNVLEILYKDQKLRKENGEKIKAYVDKTKPRISEKVLELEKILEYLHEGQ